MKRADQRKFHYLYKITRFDGKYYFGIHSTDNLEDGYFGSGTYLWKSLNRHGKEKHSKEILEFFETRQASKDKEKLLITNEMRADIKCMNIAPGGGGGFVDEQHQRKCATAGGKVGGKIAGKLNGRLNFQKGHQTMKENGTLFTRGMLGKLHSAESKLKMSESGSGRNNSQFGSRWMTKSGSLVMVKSHEIQSFLDQGFSFGRK